MTSIEKKSFSINFLTALSVIASVIGTTYGITTKLSENSSRITNEIQEVKRKQEIQTIETKNGFKTINNARKRDSATLVNNQLEMKEDVKEIKDVLDRMNFYNKKSISNNE